MTPTEQAMWHDIAEAITPYCVDGAQYIKDYVEDENCKGFVLNQMEEKVKIRLRASNIDLDFKEFPIEEDLRIFNKDKPGTFEGMPMDGFEV